jgi:hypothetical protein
MSEKQQWWMMKRMTENETKTTRLGSGEMMMIMMKQELSWTRVTKARVVVGKSPHTQARPCPSPLTMMMMMKPTC